MVKIAQAASDFLSHQRVAVTGVSRQSPDHGANVVYKRLRDRGYDVYAVNPNATEVEGDLSFPNLSSIPGGVDAVIIGTAPAHAPATVQECVDLDIKHVWFHQGPGPGSANPEAAQFGRDHGLTVIDGGCPCMFAQTADLGHRIMRPLLQLSRNVPRQV